MTSHPNTFSEVRKGDKYTFLNPDVDASYYIAEEDAPGDLTTFVNADGKRYEAEGSFGLPDDPCTILDRANNTKETVTPMLTADDRDANEAKLNVAVEYDLHAKFNYTNERGETHDVRLKPDDVYDGRVGGYSYDEDGDEEGYKQYRLDRINDKVVVR